MSEEAKPAKRGVGTAIREQLIAGKSNEAALEAVKAEFPGSATTVSSVSWYRNQLRAKGNEHNVPTAAEAKKAAAAASAPDPLDD